MKLIIWLLLFSTELHEIRIQALVEHFPNLTFIDFLQSNHEIECILYIFVVCECVYWYLKSNSLVPPQHTPHLQIHRIDRYLLIFRLNRKDFLHETFDMYDTTRNKYTTVIFTRHTTNTRLSINEVHAMIRSIWQNQLLPLMSETLENLLMRVRLEYWVKQAKETRRKF